MNLILYYMPIACSVVPLITLRDAGADFEVRSLNFQKSEQLTSEFLRFNPKHKVPVLVIDGEPLTENVAIQQWIARNFPKARLLPEDPKQEFKAISLMAWFSSGIHPYLARLSSPRKVCDLPGAETAISKQATSLLFENYAIADGLLAGREWFFDHWTTVDAYFFWCFRRAVLFQLDLSRFPNCASHFQRCQSRPSVRSALEFEREVQEMEGASATSGLIGKA